MTRLVIEGEAGSGVMKVYTCNDFKGYWPVGTSAVVVAPNEDVARNMLIERLLQMNLPQSSSFILKELNLNFAHVEILQDGDY